MFSAFEEMLLTTIETLPLIWYVAIGSFIEEVVAPIPSSAVLLSTGAFASVQNYTSMDLLPLIVIAAISKSIGAIIVYKVSAHIGTPIIERYGRFFGISSDMLLDLNTRITGTSRDYIILTILRALPIIPSAILSVGCGVLKIPVRLFVISSIIGTIVRDAIIIYVGFTGTATLYNFVLGTERIESIIQNVILLSLVLLCVYGLVRFLRRTPLLK